MAKASKKKSNSGPDLSAFFEYIQDISQEKGLARDEVMEVVRNSFHTAYTRKYGPEAKLEVILDHLKPEIVVIIRHYVVEKVTSPDYEYTLEAAREIKPDAEIGEIIEVREDPFGFSRIGATTVRQILMQRLKEMEREIIYNEFVNKEGELINGYFLRWRDNDIMYVDLGKAEGVMPRREQIPNEKFRTGDRVKAIIKSVELKREKSREPGPFITLSRATGSFVQKLFEMEIPEIYEGVVEVLGITRQAGYRTKILVRSNFSDVDPVGACVGIKGVRIQSIVRELGNERIDIVNYSDDPEELIANAISPARVSEVRVERSAREALVVVPDDSFSIAIGNGGMNVKLASQLTGYKLIVKSQSQFSEEMSRPEVRAALEAIFSAPVEEEVEEHPEEQLEELDYTPIEELPLTQRVIGLLRDSEIVSVEELLEMQPEELEKILGKHTTKQVVEILKESVVYEEEA